MNCDPAISLTATYRDIVLFAVLTRQRCNLVDVQAEVTRALAAKLKEF